MPYRRYRRRTFRRSGTKSVWRAIKAVKKMIPPVEKHQHVTAYSSATSIQDTARAPLDVSINGVAQGDGQGNRSGNQTHVTGYYGKFIFRAGDNTNVVRVVIYIPHDPSTTFSGIGVQTPVDQDLVTILEDRYITLDSDGTEVKMLTLKKSFTTKGRKGIQTQYSGSLATDLSKNNIRLYMVSDSAAVADPTVEGYLRCYFSDA